MMGGIFEVGITQFKKSPRRAVLMWHGMLRQNPSGYEVRVKLHLPWAIDPHPAFVYCKMCPNS